MRILVKLKIKFDIFFSYGITITEDKSQDFFSWDLLGLCNLCDVFNRSGKKRVPVN